MYKRQALHHPLRIDAGDLTDAEVVPSDVEILEIGKQQRLRALRLADGRGEDLDVYKRQPAACSDFIPKAGETQAHFSPVSRAFTARPHGTNSVLSASIRAT